LLFAIGTDYERLMEHALELGAEDILLNADTSVEVITSPEQMISIKEALVRIGFQPDLAEITMRAAMNMQVTDKEIAEKMINLVDALEDLDDVQSVYLNADIAETILDEIS